MLPPAYQRVESEQDIWLIKHIYNIWRAYLQVSSNEYMSTYDNE